MGRPRKPLRSRPEAGSFFSYFKHPVSGKSVCAPLGGPLEYEGNLKTLNRVFLDPDNWQSIDLLPDGPLRECWRRHLPGVPIAPAARADSAAEAVKKELHRLYSAKIAAQDREIKELKKKHQFAFKRAIDTAPAPALEIARVRFMDAYQNRDDDATENIDGSLKRFVSKFGADTPADWFVGREQEIDAWLKGLKATKRGKALPGAVGRVGTGYRERELIVTNKPISPGRRAYIRQYVLMMLDFNGVNPDRQKVKAVPKRVIDAARGPIDWLEKPEAVRLAAELDKAEAERRKNGEASRPWPEMFRLQVAIALRPDELLTLQQSNFTKDFARLTLAPLTVDGITYTLKNGPRTITLPMKARKIIRQRFARSDNSKYSPIVFWTAWCVKYFDRKYCEAIRAAAQSAGITMPVDSRTGRRTCASILIRKNMSIDAIAELLGDDRETVRRHYARILPHEVDTTAAAI